MADRPSLSPVSLRWLAQADPEQRKQRGQYLTPRPVSEALVSRLRLRPGMRVLDPGAGTGELLRAVLDREPGAETIGWEVDSSAIEAARELVPEAALQRCSALDAPAPPAGSFDLVIGNPPYFQLRLAPAQRERFAGVLSGRANVFALFFQIGLEQLRPGGLLAYIVPPSMNSGAYFEALREYLTARATVEHLEVLEGTDWFEGANTAVQLLLLRKNESDRKPGEAFVFRREVPQAGFRRVVFAAAPDLLAAEFEGRKTLWELGLEAVTGQVIWNENRHRLSAEAAPGLIPLVWSHSIGRGELRSGSLSGRGPDRKPGFYDPRDGGRSPQTGPAIVTNRVVGAVGRGELRAALIPAGTEFLAENHVNVIRPRRTPNPGGSDNRQDDRKSDPPRGETEWESVLAALLRPEVAGRVRLLTGNTQLSSRELTHLVPLDL